MASCEIPQWTEWGHGRCTRRGGGRDRGRRPCCCGCVAVVLSHHEDGDDDQCDDDCCGEQQEVARLSPEPLTDPVQLGGGILKLTTGMVALTGATWAGAAAWAAYAAPILALVAAGVDVIVFEPLLRDDHFSGVPVLTDLAEFKLIKGHVATNLASPDPTFAMLWETVPAGLVGPPDGVNEERKHTRQIRNYLRDVLLFTNNRLDKLFAKP